MVTAMPDVLAPLFDCVCGQNPAHLWTLGGVTLPCCQRCTGFHVAAAVAIALHLALRFRPTPRFLQVHGLFLLQMLPFSIHWVPGQGPMTRTLTGMLFGFGIATFLWLRPAAALHLDRRGGAGRTAGYGLGVAMALAALPLLLVNGGAATAQALAAVAGLGLAGLAVLAAANVVELAAAGIAVLRRRGAGG